MPAAGSTLTRPDVDEVTSTEGQVDLPHVLVVWDDPINLMPYVTMVFIDVLGLTEDVAHARMLEVHEQGRSQVWHGPKGKGEELLVAMHRAGLTATLEVA